MISSFRLFQKHSHEHRLFINGTFSSSKEEQIRQIVTYQLLRRERQAEQPIGTNATENLQNGQFLVGHASSKRPRRGLIIAG